MNETHESNDLAPAEALSLVDAQQRVARKKLEISGNVIVLVWGVAWLVGYGAMWATQGGVFDGAGYWWIGLTVFIAALVIAMALTIFYVIHNSAGTRGASARVGAAYGASWLIAFTVYGILSSKLVQLIPDPVNLGLVQSAIACLIVGVMYLFAGTLWQDKAMYILGVWILLSTALGALAGIPSAYLIQAIAGGGGMLISAALGLFLERRKATRGENHG